jgi:hypothetical protein
MAATRRSLPVVGQLRSDAIDPPETLPFRESGRSNPELNSDVGGGQHGFGFLLALAGAPPEMARRRRGKPVILLESTSYLKVYVLFPRLNSCENPADE